MASASAGTDPVPPSPCSNLPVRRIGSQADLEEFLTSDSFVRFYAFVQALGEACKGRTIRELSIGASPGVQWATTLLDRMWEEVSEVPPEQTMSRFGNVAFRLWLDRMRRLVPQLHQECSLLGKVSAELREEISSYLLNSLGDWQRIDYGTGHEAHFVVWLYCLASTEPALFTPKDYAHLVLTVFVRYLRLMRRLQATYWLEPAGTHGVWGLDDYHFLPFLWGAAQLVDHPHLRPRSIHDSELVEELAEDYLYLAGIHAINQVKTTSGLPWHSPLLNDISAVRTWTKVYTGLLRMYRAEVLGKLPIMQHFLFGKILSFSPAQPGDEDSSRVEPSQHRHAARLGLQGDCCGNPLPSIYSAARGRNEPCHHTPPTGDTPFD